MSQAKNHYKADLRELQFLLFEQFGVSELLGKEPFASWGPDEVKMVLDETYRFATDVLGPLNAVGDREKCKVVDGRVVTPKGFPDAWKKLYEAGWRNLGTSEEFGGQGAPRSLSVLVEELFSGANVAFMMYSGLTMGAAELIEHCGSDEQRKTFCTKMYAGQWGGTMCLTEPHAGSDVGAARTTAKEVGNGVYKISGTKIYISGGDHDCVENVIHLVLARVEGAEAGTKGLSLFIVPRVRLDGTFNDVKVASIEHKMGINGSATCVMQFGEDDGCHGVLVGGVPHQGMKQMFQMMNYARIGVGIQGLAVGSAAYMSALDYAKDRKQGSSVTAWKDPNAPRVSIIEHPDVRRMLLDMKAKCEGIRALIVKLALHQDRVTALGGQSDEVSNYNRGQVELLVPLVKSYATDQGFRICETAVQVYGGAGYTQDYPVEQYLRDAKIFSIYEGTNHIQALDLVGRKLGQAGGKHAQEFFGDVAKFVAAHGEHPVLGAAVKQLGKAHEAAGGAAFQFLNWFKGGEMQKVPLNANRFLDMLSEVAIGWLLLEGAVVALEAQGKLDKSSKDWFFYEGKKASAQMLGLNDTSAVDIPLESFASA
jgi:alkylation response protein AidB-like acyl-CoA dehydrogenase